MVQKTELDPILKWCGGKRWLADRLYKLYAPYEATHRWIEPFCGGLGATLGVMPFEAILNDINPTLIGFYQWVQSGGIPTGLDGTNSAGNFYTNRNKFNWYRSLISKGTELDQFSLSQYYSLFYWLNRGGYNGLFRVNGDDGFNVPQGSYNRVKLNYNLKPYREAFKNWTFTRGRFIDMVIPPGSFIYADPPYWETFDQYSTEGFSWEDHQQLAEFIMLHNCPAVISNSASVELAKMYQSFGYKVYAITADRGIGDRKQLEILATINL